MPSGFDVAPFFSRSGEEPWDFLHEIALSLPPYLDLYNDWTNITWVPLIIESICTHYDQQKDCSSWQTVMYIYSSDTIIVRNRSLFKTFHTILLSLPIVIKNFGLHAVCCIMRIILFWWLLYSSQNIFNANSLFVAVHLGVKMADTLSFTAKGDMVDFWV